MVWLVSICEDDKMPVNLAISDEGGLEKAYLVDVEGVVVTESVAGTDERGTVCD